MEDKIKQLLDEQLRLGENITSTSQLLRFVLNLSSQNLVVIRGQLEKIRTLSSALEEEAMQNPAAPTDEDTAV